MDYTHILAVVVLQTIFAALVTCLTCFTCENEQYNSVCIGPDQVTECTPEMNTCQTIVSFSHVSNKLAIHKSCTKNASCELQILADQENTPCDVTRHSWVCTSCCHSDLCNVNNAVTIDISHMTIFGIVLFVMGIVLG